MQFYNTFGYQWLEGSIRKDLDRGGRGDWADLLSLASISRRAGYLERSPGIPYTVEEMAMKFFIPVEQLRQTLVICCKEGRISLDGHNTYFITNWNKYQKIPLGTIASTKVIKPKPQKPKSEEQMEAITRRLVNQHPEAARDALGYGFGDTIVTKGNEIIRPNGEVE